MYTAKDWWYINIAFYPAWIVYFTYNFWNNHANFFNIKSNQFFRYLWIRANFSSMEFPTTISFHYRPQRSWTAYVLLAYDVHPPCSSLQRIEQTCGTVSNSSNIIEFILLLVWFWYLTPINSILRCKILTFCNMQYGSNSEFKSYILLEAELAVKKHHYIILRFNNNCKMSLIWWQGCIIMIRMFKLLF